MEIHKPKPFHGWRELLKEYGIIVIGVLTALGAEQTVEWLHWQRLASEARVAVTQDHQRLLENIGETDVASACVSHRLDELRAILDRAGQTGRLPALGDVSAAPGEPWIMRGWEGVVSGQTLPHLKPGEGARYTAQTTRLDFLRKVRDTQLENWAVLRTMTGPGRRLSDAEVANLRATLGRATAEANSTRIHADALGKQIIDSGLLPQPEVEAAWKHGADRLPGIPICQPLAPFNSQSLDTPALTAPATPPHEHFDRLDGPFRLHSQG